MNTVHFLFHRQSKTQKMLSIFRGITSKITPYASILSNSQLHTSAFLQFKEPKHFLSYNDKVYPPQSPDEEPRKAVRDTFTLLFCSLDCTRLFFFCLYYFHCSYMFPNVIFSTFAIKRPTLSTVQRICGILLVWFVECKSMRPFVSYV